MFRLEVLDVLFLGPETSYVLEVLKHRLNIELDLQCLFWLSCSHWLRSPQLPPSPPAFGLLMYKGAIGQPR
jgi:hypothetical protein